MSRAPGDWASGALSAIAQTLRDDAAREAPDRRLRGHSGDALRLAADALDLLAVGKDARATIDWRRKVGPMERAMDAVELAAKAGAKDWTTAIAEAAGTLNREVRTIEKHVEKFLTARGMTRADYLIFSTEARTLTP